MKVKGGTASSSTPPPSAETTPSPKTSFRAQRKGPTHSRNSSTSTVSSSNQSSDDSITDLRKEALEAAPSRGTSSTLKIHLIKLIEKFLKRLPWTAEYKTNQIYKGVKGTFHTEIRLDQAGDPQVLKDELKTEVNHLIDNFKWDESNLELSLKKLNQLSEAVIYLDDNELKNQVSAKILEVSHLIFTQSESNTGNNPVLKIPELKLFLTLLTQAFKLGAPQIHTIWQNAQTILINSRFRSLSDCLTEVCQLLRKMPDDKSKVDLLIILEVQLSPNSFTNEIKEIIKTIDLSSLDKENIKTILSNQKIKLFTDPRRDDNFSSRKEALMRAHVFLLNQSGLDQDMKDFCSNELKDLIFAPRATSDHSNSWSFDCKNVGRPQFKLELTQGEIPNDEWNIIQAMFAGVEITDSVSTYLAGKKPYEKDLDCIAEINSLEPLNVNNNFEGFFLSYLAITPIEREKVVIELLKPPMDKNKSDFIADLLKMGSGEDQSKLAKLVLEDIRMRYPSTYDSKLLLDDLSQELLSKSLIYISQLDPDQTAWLKAKVTHLISNQIYKSSPLLTQRLNDLMKFFAKEEIKELTRFCLAEVRVTANSLHNFHNREQFTMRFYELMEVAIGFASHTSESQKAKAFKEIVQVESAVFDQFLQFTPKHNDTAKIKGLLIKAQNKLEQIEKQIQECKERGEPTVAVLRSEAQQLKAVIEEINKVNEQLIAFMDCCDKIIKFRRDCSLDNDAKDLQLLARKDLVLSNFQSTEKFYRFPSPITPKLIDMDYNCSAVTSDKKMLRIKLNQLRIYSEALSSQMDLLREGFDREPTSTLAEKSEQMGLSEPVTLKQAAQSRLDYYTEALNDPVGTVFEKTSKFILKDYVNYVGKSAAKDQGDADVDRNRILFRTTGSSSFYWGEDAIAGAKGSKESRVTAKEAALIVGEKLSVDPDILEKGIHQVAQQLDAYALAPVALLFQDEGLISRGVPVSKFPTTELEIEGDRVKGSTFTLFELVDQEGDLGVSGYFVFGASVDLKMEKQGGEVVVSADPHGVFTKQQYPIISKNVVESYFRKQIRELVPGIDSTELETLIGEILDPQNDKRDVLFEAIVNIYQKPNFLSIETGGVTLPTDAFHIKREYEKKDILFGMIDQWREMPAEKSTKELVGSDVPREQIELRKFLIAKGKLKKSEITIPTDSANLNDPTTN